jgi:hypothetical protein
MDRTLLLRRLAQAEARVVQGEQHSTRQYGIVADQERDGRDASKARQLLTKFEEQQAMRVADRDYLKTELSKISS